MNFTMETKDKAFARISEALEVETMEIKPYNDFAGDLRFILRFKFDNVSDKEKALLKAYKLRSELGFDIVGHSDMQDNIHISIFVSPKSDKYEIIVFDRDLKKQDFKISKDTKDSALIAFFEYFGFKVILDGENITTSRGRSRITSKGWKGVFEKREYDLIPNDMREHYQNKIALFNYQGNSYLTSLNYQGV